MEGRIFTMEQSKETEREEMKDEAHDLEDEEEDESDTDEERKKQNNNNQQMQ